MPVSFNVANVGEGGTGGGTGDVTGGTGAGAGTDAVGLPPPEHAERTTSANSFRIAADHTPEPGTQTVL